MSVRSARQFLFARGPERRFAREDDPESTLPSIFTALQEEMGIKLVLAKVPVEMVVIDHLERRPTEN